MVLPPICPSTSRRMPTSSEIQPAPVRLGVGKTGIFRKNTSNYWMWQACGMKKMKSCGCCLATLAIKT